MLLTVISTEKGDLTIGPRTLPGWEAVLDLLGDGQEHSLQSVCEVMKEHTDIQLTSCLAKIREATECGILIRTPSGVRFGETGVFLEDEVIEVTPETVAEAFARYLADHQWHKREDAVAAVMEQVGPKLAGSKARSVLNRLVDLGRVQQLGKNASNRMVRLKVKAGGR